MPQPLVLIEQGELGAGVQAFAAHDDVGARRIVGQVDHAGQLGDLSTGTERPVLVQCWMPQMVGQLADRAAVSPVISARSASNHAPACPTTPIPSAVTWTLGRNPISCT